MTEFFRLDDLTWQEVAALPRNLPILLPLGDGFSLPQTAAALQHPPRIALLPPFPFGWQGSGLEASPNSLAQALTNLIQSLREDGFDNAHILAPEGFDLPGISLPLPGYTPKASVQLHPADQNKVILLPVGHTEQHALHLPLSVDTLIIEAIALGTVRAAPQACLSLPVMPYGVSTHRASFAGTLNTGGRAFEDFWLSILANLAGRGFTRFYLINGHGGNHSFLVNIVKYAGERHPHTFCATAWLHTSGDIGAAALQAHRQSAVGGMGHAGELETSMMLALRPDLVHMDRVKDDTDFIATPNYYMDWIEGGALIANPPWQDDSRYGAYGAGSLATPEKGKQWLQAAIAEKAGHVAEIDEQYRRRAERRRTGWGKV